MSPASRNDPCPCGSGAKYKRCCLDKDEAERTRAAAAEAEARAAIPVEPEPTDEDLAIEDELDHDPWLAEAVDHPFDESRSPWALAHFAAKHPTFAAARKREPEWAETPALPDEVRALSDDAIRARLYRLGIEVPRRELLAAIEASTSGWDLAAAWRAGKTLKRWERDFVGLAACELWRRLAPGKPSREMLEDAVEDGYADLEAHRRDEALERWRAVLDVLLARLPAGARSLADAPGSPTGVDEWLEDWLDEVHAAAQEDPGEALSGLRLVDAILGRAPDQGRGTLRAARSSFLIFLGRDAEGLAEARALRDAQPDRAIGYIALADALTLAAERDPERIAEAADVLWEARRRPVVDAAEWRLEELHRERVKLLKRARSGR